MDQGRESARLLAAQDSIQKIYLACRNEPKAKAAKAQLEAATGRKIFEIVLLDIMKPETVRAAVAKLATPMDAVILNAGGSGGTTGTAGFDDLPFIKRLFFKHLGGVLIPRLGMMHKIETGAKRYIDGLLEPKFKSGCFYASAGKFPTGPVIDQASQTIGYSNPEFQDNANMAVRQFV